MDPYQRIAAFYDIEHEDFAGDIQFYRQYIQAGPVLEIGAGTGRLMRPLLDAGWEVWGIDPSGPMLERARHRVSGCARAHLIQQSAEHLNLPMRFETVILPLNTLSHLGSLDAQIAALAAIRRHANPGGMLIVDQSNPLSMADRGGAGEVRKRLSRTVGATSLSGWSAVWDDEGEQMLNAHLWYDSTEESGIVSRTETTLLLRYLYRFELELLLRLSAFSVSEIHGSYDLEPYSAVSPRLIAIAFAETH